jgi:hypothetical protein
VSSPDPGGDCRFVLRRPFFGGGHWRGVSVFPMNRGAGGQVVALAQPAEMRQAEYYRAVLSERRAEVEDEIADQSAALAQRRDAPGMPRLVERIAENRKEQFELDRLLGALERRFFPRPETPPKNVRCFDIEISRCGSWWNVEIPEIAAAAKARRRDGAEMVARAYIAAVIGVPIVEVGVRVVCEP